METLRDIELQRWIEERYNRRHIDGKIRAEIQSNPDMQARLQQGVTLLQDWLDGQYYESKMARLAQLKSLELPSLVLEIFTGIAYCQRPELFTSVTAQLAGRLGFNDKTDAIKTMAEIVAVLCNTDAYDINKPDRMAPLEVISRIPLSQELITFIEDSAYLPPMVCLPLPLKQNYDSGYLTHRDSLVLGKGNHHDGDLCLAVLNTVNRVALKLDLDFLSRVEEQPSFALDTPDKQSQWQAFKLQSYRFYSLMEQAGNRFYLTHKVDKRGRIYASGYHINSQGTPFKKAMLELAEEELMQGVPT